MNDTNPDIENDLEPEPESESGLTSRGRGRAIAIAGAIAGAIAIAIAMFAGDTETEVAQVEVGPTGFYLYDRDGTPSGHIGEGAEWVTVTLAPATFRYNGKIFSVDLTGKTKTNPVVWSDVTTPD